MAVAASYGRCWTAADNARGALDGAIDPGAPCFRLSDLTTTSQKADNTPNATEREALRQLAVTVLQPIRDLLGPVRVNSGFRSAEVNALVKGSDTSEHRHGNAVDLAVEGFTNREVATYLYIVRETMPLDQVIWYTNTSHVHIGRILHSSGRPRALGHSKAFLSATKEGGGADYKAWAPTQAEQDAVIAKILALPHRATSLEDPLILPRP